MLLPGSILSRILYYNKFATFETYLTANKIPPHSVFVMVSAISGLNIPMAAIVSPTGDINPAVEEF